MKLLVKVFNMGKYVIFIWNKKYYKENQKNKCLPKRHSKGWNHTQEFVIFNSKE
jgi:hypothetical protein